MLRSTTRTLFFTGWLLCGMAATGQAETVLKIDLGNDSTADLVSVGGILSTRDQANPATTGHQDTNVIFLDALDAHHPDILAGDASFSLLGINLTGATATFGTTVFQATSGGSFEVYNSANLLVLKGSLADGTLSGPIGSSSTGSFLTAAFGTFTGGSLANLLDPNSLSLAISLTNVVSTGGQRGLQLVSNGLAGFTADATANIGGFRATIVPEPVTSVAWLGGLLALISLRRRT